MSKALFLSHKGKDIVRNRRTTFKIFIVAASLLLANSAYAFDMGNMMNPSKWMGGNKDRDRYDDYYGGPGYGGPGYGGAPGYGYGSAPGYGGAPTYGAPGAGSNEEEIRRLKERIRQLEGGLR